MRAMQNYDKIQFKNNFEREEFITTIIRDDIPENEGVKLDFEGINTENEGINIDLEKIFRLFKE
jgi:hypothetical protein